MQQKVAAVQDLFDARAGKPVIVDAADNCCARIIPVAERARPLRADDALAMARELRGLHVSARLGGADRADMRLTAARLRPSFAPNASWLRPRATRISFTRLFKKLTSFLVT